MGKLFEILAIRCMGFFFRNLIKIYSNHQQNKDSDAVASKFECMKNIALSQADSLQSVKKFLGVSIGIALEHSLFIILFRSLQLHNHPQCSYCSFASQGNEMSKCLRELQSANERVSTAYK